jgi:hypothetical protein
MQAQVLGGEMLKHRSQCRNGSVRGVQGVPCRILVRSASCTMRALESISAASFSIACRPDTCLRYGLGSEQPKMAPLHLGPPFQAVCVILHRVTHTCICRDIDSHISLSSALDERKMSEEKPSSKTALPTILVRTMGFNAQLALNTRQVL